MNRDDLLDLLLDFIDAEFGSKSAPHEISFAAQALLDQLKQRREMTRIMARLVDE